jgi:hypothetical protein
MPHTPPVVALPGTDAHVMSAADGSTVLRLSSGRFLRVQEPPPDLLDALADENQRTNETAEYVQTLHEVIATRETADAETRWPPQRRVVGLVGEGTIIDGIADALQGWGVDLQRFTTAQQLLEDRDRRLQAAEKAYSLVIAYADTPRDRADWERMDELPQSGCAWLRAYREGQICFVDPLSTCGEDPSSEQVLRRRLAANPTPSLFTTWHEAVVHAEPLTVSAQALITGRLLTAALMWAQAAEATGSLRSTLWKFVPATGRISEHTVLGYSAPYMPEETVVRQ